MSNPLEATLSRLAPEHQYALRWLAERQGSSRKRPWSRELVSDPTAPAVKLTAQRGIHVPAGWDMALTVALTRESKYRDGDLEQQPDGTWVLLLRAHEGGDGVGLRSGWNRGLYNCMVRRVPVAVFLPVRGSDYQWLGLAFVDDYDPVTRSFILHGPLTASSQEADWGMLEPTAEQNVPDWFLGVSDPSTWTDERVVRPAMSTIRANQQEFRRLLLDAYKGRCAVSGYDADATLDAAHILPFQGRLSDTARNGLLLRTDLHRLFDRYLIAVDTSDMTVTVGSGLQRTRYAGLSGAPLDFPKNELLAPSIRHLDLHRERFERAESVCRG